MSGTAPQKLTPGRRYLIRRASWSPLLEEARVIAKTKTGVYIEDGHGSRSWHMLAYGGVGQWVILEDLGPWNPHRESDEAAELRAGFDKLVYRLDAALKETVELRAALEAVYQWLRSEFAEPDPTTGEAVEAAAREIWETVCAVLAASEGSTEPVVARDDAAELRAALEMLLNASHRGGYDSGLTIEAVERAEALIAPGLTQERRIELAHAAWLDGLKRRLTTFEESRLAASEGES